MVAIRQPGARLLAAGLLLGLLLGCDNGAEELNSERIERLFGSYRVDVLEQSAHHRLANLHSIHDSTPICRTLAIVRYHRPVAAELRDAHQEILAGGSIGATLQNRGWRVKKLNQQLGDIVAPASAERLRTLMQISLPQTLALHAYQLNAVRDGAEYEYATIIELHHPDYLSAEALHALYDDQPAISLSAEKLMEIRDLARSSMHNPP